MQKHKQDRNQNAKLIAKWTKQEPPFNTPLGELTLNQYPEDRLCSVTTEDHQGNKYKGICLGEFINYYKKADSFVYTKITVCIIFKESEEKKLLFIDLEDQSKQVQYSVPILISPAALNYFIEFSFRRSIASSSNFPFKVCPPELLVHCLIINDVIPSLNREEMLKLESVRLFSPIGHEEDANRVYLNIYASNPHVQYYAIVMPRHKEVIYTNRILFSKSEPLPNFKGELLMDFANMNNFLINLSSKYIIEQLPNIVRFLWTSNKEIFTRPAIKLNFTSKKDSTTFMIFIVLLNRELHLLPLAKNFIELLNSKETINQDHIDKAFASTSTCKTRPTDVFNNTEKSWALFAENTERKNITILDIGLQNTPSRIYLPPYSTPEQDKSYRQRLVDEIGGYTSHKIDKFDESFSSF